jgi:hypothetical protein
VVRRYRWHESRQAATSRWLLLVLLLAVAEHGSLLENLQPQLPDLVVAVYELPKSALRGARLQVEDLGSGDMGTIALGLLR